MSEVRSFPWGDFVFFSDPDGNGCGLQQLPTSGSADEQPPEAEG